MKFTADYDLPGYMERPDVAPRGKITRRPASMDEASEIVDAYLKENWRTLARPPKGELKYPYLVPGSVYNTLWDWDGFFIAAGAPDEAAEYLTGTALDLIDSPLRDGRPSKMSSPDGNFSYGAHPYPLRAQFLLMCLRRFGDRSILTPERMEKILRTLEFYERETADGDGFFRWLSMSGIDNNPAVYGRNVGETAGADLMSFHLREYLAVAELLEMGGESGVVYRDRAEKVKQLLLRRHRNENDGFYYDLHRPVAPLIRKQRITWVNRIPYRGCSGVFPLWAGAADRETVKAAWRIFADEKEFMTPWGIRSLSKREPMYNNAPGANPSNWQGPIWSLPNALLAYALNEAGMREEALELAGRLVALLASDILSNGCLHECYDAETGEPLMKPGFISWHLLALELRRKIANGTSPFRPHLRSGGPLRQIADKIRTEHQKRRFPSCMIPHFR